MKNYLHTSTKKRKEKAKENIIGGKKGIIYSRYCYLFNSNIFKIYAAFLYVLHGDRDFSENSRRRKHFFLFYFFFKKKKKGPFNK